MSKHKFVSDLRNRDAEISKLTLQLNILKMDKEQKERRIEKLESENRRLNRICRNLCEKIWDYEHPDGPSSQVLKLGNTLASVATLLSPNKRTYSSTALEDVYKIIMEDADIVEEEISLVEEKEEETD